MAPFRNRDRSNRSGRGQVEHNVLEGLPINQYKEVEITVGPNTTDNKQLNQDDWPAPPMPRDSHMLPEHSQQILARARAGRIYKPPAPVEEDKEALDEEEEHKEVRQGFTVKKWIKVPRHLEEPEPEYLAKRRKGLPSQYGAVTSTAISLPPPMRETKVKKTDAEGNVNVYKVLVPEGQAVEGEVQPTESITDAAVPAPGTVVEGVGVVNAEGVVVASDLLQQTPPRRRPPPPKKKKKSGPGRGKKKVLFAEGTTETGTPISSTVSQLLTVSGLKQEGSVEPSEGGDTPMPDAADEDEGSGEEGSDDDDHEDNEEHDDQEDAIRTPTPAQAIPTPTASAPVDSAAAQPTLSAPVSAEPALAESIPAEYIPTESAPVASVPLEPIPTESVQAGIVPTEIVAAEIVPSESAPSEPVLSEPAPSKPAPLEPVPSKPVPSEPVPSEPVPSEAVPPEPVPSEPVPSEPVPPEPVPSEPVPSEPVPSEPGHSEPTPSEPVPFEPAPFEPATAGLTASEPALAYDSSHVEDANSSVANTASLMEAPALDAPVDQTVFAPQTDGPSEPAAQTLALGGNEISVETIAKHEMEAAPPKDPSSSPELPSSTASNSVNQVPTIPVPELPVLEDVPKIATEPASETVPEPAPELASEPAPIEEAIAPSAHEQQEVVATSAAIATVEASAPSGEPDLLGSLERQLEQDSETMDTT